MENCVGERNHPLFLAYLTLQLLVLLWGVYLAWWVLPLLGGMRAGGARDSHRCWDLPCCPLSLSCLQVWPPLLPALESVAAVQRPPVRHFPAPVDLLWSGCPALGLTPLPGGPKHHHMGVHLSPPNQLPPPAPWKPIRPWPGPKPRPLLQVALSVLGKLVGGGPGRSQ